MTIYGQVALIGQSKHCDPCFTGNAVDGKFTIEVNVDGEVRPVEVNRR